MADNALMRGAYSTADINRGLGNVVRERGFLAPFATYGDNSTGFAWPEIIHGPASAINSLMTNPTPYLDQSPEEKRQTIGNAFEAAGTATLGSFAGSRPAGALAAGAGRVEKGAEALSEIPQAWPKLVEAYKSGGDTALTQAMADQLPSLGMRGQGDNVFRGYRGSISNDKPFGQWWASSDPEVAGLYAEAHKKNSALDRYLKGVNPELVDNERIIPSEFRFSNPLVVDAGGADWNRVPYNGRTVTTDGVMDSARTAGHDGVVIRNVIDDPGTTYYSGKPQDTIAAIKPGTVYSPLTGELLYANAKTGAAVPLATEAAKHQNALMQNQIRAYHGSPHDFDKFDLSKIGTGEGAQAYGHGLYFAENEGVAKSYRDVLSSGFNGRADDARAAAARAMEYHGNDKAKALADLEQNANGYPPRAELLREAQRLIETDTWKPGKMYEVSINAHPDDFLDWDKPLSQQSEKVQSAMKAVRPYLIEDGTGTGGGWTPWKSEGASKKLAEAGIPGIRYLDQGSRTAGEGSRNYVVFDDALVEILRKYGLLGTLGAGAAASAYGAPPAEAAPTNALMRPNR